MSDPENAISAVTVAHKAIRAYWGDMEGQADEQAKELHRLADADPMAAIGTVERGYAEWMGYESFPFDHNHIPHDGDPESYKVEHMIDRDPTEEFKAGFSLHHHALTLSRRDYAKTYSSRIRDIVISLGQIGLVPVSTEWLAGAEARTLCIPRLGAKGDWGRGWLFAHNFHGWEGAKGTVANLSWQAPMSPSEWRWAVETDLVAAPWNEHMGNPGEWDWDALDHLAEADRKGLELLSPEDAALFDLAARFAKQGHTTNAKELWAETLRTMSNLKCEPLEFAFSEAGFGGIVFKDLAFVTGAEGTGIKLEPNRVPPRFEQWSVDLRRVVRLRSRALSASVVPVVRNVVEGAPSRQKAIHEAIRPAVRIIVSDNRRVPTHNN